MRKTNLERIASLIGDQRALALARSVKPAKSGYLSLYIPSKPNQRLVNAVGEESASILCDYLGSAQLTLERPERFERRRIVRQLLANPLISITEIAQTAHCSRQYVYSLWG